MKEFIKAFQIFLKYSNDLYPTGCEHDIMYVYISPYCVSSEDIDKLNILGFNANDEGCDCFQSTKYGSA